MGASFGGEETPPLSYQKKKKKSYQGSPEGRAVVRGQGKHLRVNSLPKQGRDALRTIQGVSSQL